jgi:hypothetical protein
MEKSESKLALEIRSNPATVTDANKVRIGGESPSFGPIRMNPVYTADLGKVRIGGESPSFGPIRADIR